MYKSLSLEMQLDIARTQMKPILQEMLRAVNKDITLKELKCLDSLCAFIYGQGSKEHKLFRDTLHYDNLYSKLKMREYRHKEVIGE